MTGEMQQTLTNRYIAMTLDSLELSMKTLLGVHFDDFESSRQRQECFETLAQTNQFEVVKILYTRAHDIYAALIEKQKKG